MYLGEVILEYGFPNSPVIKNLLSSALSIEATSSYGKSHKSLFRRGHGDPKKRDLTHADEVPLFKRTHKGFIGQEGCVWE